MSFCQVRLWSSGWEVHGFYGGISPFGCVCRVMKGAIAKICKVIYVGGVVRICKVTYQNTHSAKAPSIKKVKIGSSTTMCYSRRQKKDEKDINTIQLECLLLFESLSQHKSQEHGIFSKKDSQ